MPTYYNNIKKVTSNLLDGGLSLAATGTRPTILVCGPAKQGLTEVPQLCVDETDAVRFFGEDTVLEKKVAEIIAQAGTEAFFIYAMRVGGQAPTVTLTDDSADASVLTITPLNYKDKEATERLGLIFIPHDSDDDQVADEQRFLLWDIEEETVVFDSHDIISTGEVLFEVELTLNGTATDFTGNGGFYQHAWDSSNNSIVVADIVPILSETGGAVALTYPSGPNSANLNAGASGTLTASVSSDTVAIGIPKAGNDGESIPLMQRYTFLARALEDLAFNEFDYILPVGSYFLDAPNIADCTTDGDPLSKILHHEHVSATPVYPIADLDFSTISALSTASGSFYEPEERIPARVSSSTQTDILGWLWQTEYAQKNYYYFAKAKGWDNFVPKSDQIVLSVPSETKVLSIDDASANAHTFDITFEPGFGADGGISLVIVLDNTTPMQTGATGVANVTGALTLTLGIQNNTMSDVQTWLETYLDAAISAALAASSPASSRVSVSSTLFSGAELLAPAAVTTATAFAASTVVTPILSGSLTLDFTFSVDAVSVEFTTNPTTSLVETAGALVINIDPAQTLGDLDTAITNYNAALTGNEEIAIAQSGLAGASALLIAPPLIVTSTNSVVSTIGLNSMNFDNNYLDHKELTGEDIPAAVSAKFTNAKAAEFRECSFAHLVGSYCHKSSTVWKTTLSCLSVQPPYAPPTAKKISIGTGPEYTSISGDLAIDTVADGGTGLLGWKFLAGAPAYRNQLLSKAANSSDGFAYGGLILTEGNNLPKGTESYGIDDNDEAKDAKGFAVDIGKYVIPCAMWIVHNNAAGSYQSSLTGLITSKVGTTPMGQEPIGIVNGRVSNIIGQLMRLKYPYQSIDRLSGAGYATIIYRPTRGGVTYINNIRTLAHRSSDYRKLSTIRSVNFVVQGIRDLAEDYIGLAYNSSNVASLRTAVNGYLRAQQSAGVHNGAVAQISFNQQDRILGNINIKLTMVPPYAIESITVTTSLVADQSNL